jgi:hypothetical protein
MSLTTLDLQRELYGETIPQIDTEAVEAVARYETNGHRIPQDLRTIICWKEIQTKILNAFPTKNRLVPPSDWELLTLRGYPVIRIMDGNDDCYWYVSWRTGDKECHVFVSETKYDRHHNVLPGDNARDTLHLALQLTSDSLVKFLIGYCRSGKEWSC